jgi:hypothetical protein
MRFAISAAPRHPITATEDQRYDEASQHRSDYRCARVCRACFGTAYGSGPGTGPGVILPGGFGPSSPLHNLNEGLAGLSGAAPSWKVQE